MTLHERWAGWDRAPFTGVSTSHVSIWRTAREARRMIQLVPGDLATIDAALAGDDVLAGVLGRPVVPGWMGFAGALEAIRGALAANPDGPRWRTRLFVTEEELVGWGGFKGPPRDGAVEIGYEIAPSRQRRGLATAAARAMIDEAFAAAVDPPVAAVLAHTLPERNASNRILENLGFRFEGEALEDDEPVWRFRLERPEAAPPT